MAKNLIELLVGSLDEKKRWRAYKARTKQLPEPYKSAIDGIERYLMYSGDGPMGGDRLLAMYDDLADLFERAAVDGTPVRDIVVDDPFVGRRRKWITRLQASILATRSPILCEAALLLARLARRSM